MNRIGFFVFLVLTFVAFGALHVGATDYASSSFIIRDPVIGGTGGYGTSSNFQLFSSGDFVFSGKTPSSGNFSGRFGFLYFPFVTQPTLAATAGNAQVDLSWSASDAGLGFSVSGYEYGVSTTSGNGYTFYNVGNVTSTSSTGLTNGTTYYFVVRTLDAFGTPIITSSEVSATPTDGSTPAPAPVSSGRFMGVQFRGYAYPQAVVSVLKNAVLRATTKADTTGSFALTLQEEYDDTILYTLYADDSDGNRSLLLNYPLVEKEKDVTEISGIKFAPTIKANKITTKRGDPIVVSGFATPNTRIEFPITGPVSKTIATNSDGLGRYSVSVTTADLSQGEYELRAHYIADSRYSLTVQFVVGDVNIIPASDLLVLPGDCNADHAITIQDFSVLAYWYGKPHPPACIDANHDGAVNLVDFSILAYYWTG